MLLPDVSSARLRVVVQVTLVDTTGLLASSSESTGFSVLVNGVDDPVDSGIPSDGLVLGVDQDDLIVLVGSILVDPVRVQNSQVGTSSSNSLLSSSSQRSLVLELRNTHVSGLTVGSTLGHRSLSATSSHSDSVDNVSLLGLVTKLSSLVRSRRSGSSVDSMELSVFPASNSQKESNDVGLLVSGDFFQVLVGTHC